MITSAWYVNPAVQSLALPLLVALLVAGLLRLAGGRQKGTLLAAAGIGAGFLAGNLAVLGLPHWPPLAALQKLPYVAAAGIVAGLVLDLRQIGRKGRIIAVFAAALLVVGWVGWPVITSGDGDEVVAFALLWLLSSGVMVSLGRPGGQATGPAVMLCAAAIGIAVLIVLSDSTSAAQLAVGFAAACIGFFALAWPLGGLAFAASGQLGAGLALLALVAGVLTSGDLEPAALPMLLPVFLAGRLSGALMPSRTGMEGALRPLLTFIIALVPVLAAAGLHRVLQDPLFWS